MIKKIKINIVLLLLISSSISFGQSYVGAFVGLNSSKLAGDSSSNAEYKALMGANVGAYFDLKLSTSLLLSFQPSYSQEGTKVSVAVRGLDEPVDSLTFRFNYFSLPLLLKVRSMNKRFYALGGLEAGLILSSFVSSHDIEEDIKTDISEFNVAMHFGVGYRIPIGYPRLFIELRYAQGILNLTDEPIEGSIIPRVKTSRYKILTGLEIPLKKSDK